MNELVTAGGWQRRGESYFLLDPWGIFLHYQVQKRWKLTCLFGLPEVKGNRGCRRGLLQIQIFLSVIILNGESFITADLSNPDDGPS